MKSPGQVRPRQGGSALRNPEFLPGAPTIVRPKRNPNGVIVAHGVSSFDGEYAPWVCVVTGLKSGSVNSKTGTMLQSWIIRADMDPTEAVNSGADKAICGDCIHRKRTYTIDGKTVKTCYVRTYQAPRSVYECFKAGGYREAPPADYAKIYNSRVRIGSYGDPALVPLKAIKAITPKKKRHRTGYTQQWRTRPDLRPYVMASVTNDKDRLEAESLGWRCFFIRPLSDLGKPLPRGYGLCPSDKSVPKHKQVSCYNCGACHGNPDETKSKGEVIYAHGAAGARFGQESKPMERPTLKILN